ncbi:MAG: amino acid permease [Desulfobacterales bacterium]|nr:amino acid permease [Desulfobacterales bacterium]
MMVRNKGPLKGTMGTFAGVFTPSILTILGIILFLRLGFVVGEAGLLRALSIIALANAISILTSLSLSAIATNLNVKGGGDYYVISRTLGPEFGGALGLVLFLAQSVSIAFYCIGFGEALAVTLPPAWAVSPRLAATLAVTALLVLAWLGADWATRFQYVVMGLLVAALASFYAGALETWRPARIVLDWQSPGGSLPFWAVFAIFFPAVTGFTQGVSMSGDLRDPGRSIPLGTFLAVGLSILVYFSVAVLFAGVLPEAVLRSDYGAMKRVARMGALVDAGVIAATLSSAMASFLGGPRILQSLAGDRIFAFLSPFAQGAGAANNPRRAVLLSAAIAYATVALGNLNLIAPIVSMFFLISYGLLNYATYFEAHAASPSFRPRFRFFDHRLSLVGALACLAVMVAIDWRASVVALSILLAVFQYVKRTAGPSRWADSRRSYHLQQVRANLLKAAAEPAHDRDWRPYILAFNNRPARAHHLLTLAAWLEGGSGLTVLAQIIEGHGVKARAVRESAQQELQQAITKGNFNAFPLAVASEDMETGVHHLTQTVGIGPLKTNTVLFNWNGNRAPGGQGFQEIIFGRHLREAFRQGCHALILATDEDRWPEVTHADRPRIDIWWQNDASGRLMLLLAYLITRHADWADGQIRVLAADEALPGTPDEDGRMLADLLATFRIEGEPLILPSGELEELKRATSDTALLFLPFRFRDNLIALEWQGPVDDILQQLPSTVLTDAARDLDLEAEPEEGRAAEEAEIRDTLKTLKDRLEEARRDAARAAEAVERSQARLTAMLEAQTGFIELQVKKALEREVEAAVFQAEKNRRRAFKLEAKLALAQRAAVDAGVSIPEAEEDNLADSEN